MFGSSILEIVIGLIFIFFLYSLMTVSIFELIANISAFKARLLRKTIIRMLTDDDEPSNSAHSFKEYLEKIKCKTISFFYFLFKIFKTNKANKTTLATSFYETPHIKYLGLGNWYKRPTAIEPKTFSETLTFILSTPSGANQTTEAPSSDDLAAYIDLNLTKGKIPINPPLSKCNNNNTHCSTTDSTDDLPQLIIDPKTLQFLRDRWQKAEKNRTKFEELLIQWFNETIEQLKIKYKFKAQIYTFILGLLIAIALNVDTISIVKLLSSDSNTRAQIIEIANQYKDLGDNEKVTQKPLENSKPLNTANTTNPSKSDGSTNLSNSSDTIVEQNMSNEDIQKSRELLSEVYAITKQKNNLLAFGWEVPKTNIELAKQITENSFKTKYIDGPSFNKLKEKPLILDSIYTYNHYNHKIEKKDLTHQIVIFNNKYAIVIYAPLDSKSVKTSALAFYNPLKLNDKEERLIKLANRSTDSAFIDTLSRSTPPIKLLTIPEFNSYSFVAKILFILSQLKDLAKLVGLVITAIAISLGAPFWYDLLSKMISLKSGKASTTSEQNK